MDPITHGLLGASLATCTAKKDEIKRSSICGALGGMAPDLDIFIRSQSDPLLAIEYHRYFTHALLFIPFGGLIVALFLYLFLRKNIAFKRIYMFTTIGYAAHGLLDACTTYGTNLYWPFSDHRESWDIISVIDPIFTIPLLIFLLLSIFRKSINFTYAGIGVSCSYLLFCFIQHEKAKNFILNIAEARGHSRIEKILISPTIGNSILWRSVYQAGGHYYTDAIRTTMLSSPTLKKGVEVQVIDKEKIFPELGNDSIQRKDVERFSHFAQGYIYLYSEPERIIGDLRYGTPPQSAQPLWGIKIDQQHPDKHVTFLSMTKINSGDLSEFWQMLRGNFFSDKN